MEGTHLQGEPYQWGTQPSVLRMPPRHAPGLGGGSWSRPSPSSRVCRQAIPTFRGRAPRNVKGTQQYQGFSILRRSRSFVIPLSLFEGKAAGTNIVRGCSIFGPRAAGLSSNRIARDRERKFKNGWFPAFPLFGTLKQVSDSNQKSAPTPREAQLARARQGAEAKRALRPPPPFVSLESGKPSVETAKKRQQLRWIPWKPP